MLKSCYGKGRRFEYEVRDFLKIKGYYVTRSAASAFPDLVAVDANHAVFVECKNHTHVPKKPYKLLSKDEFDEAMVLMEKYQRPFILFYKKDHKMHATSLGNGGCVLIALWGLPTNEVSRDGSKRDKRA